MQAQQTQQLYQMLQQLLKTSGGQTAHMLCDILLSGKNPQKFVFNFIRVFTTTQDLSFNELNMRKCLTVKVNTGKQEVSFLQSLQTSNPLTQQETNESFLILLKFALDTEGGPQAQLWLQQLHAAVGSVRSVRLMLQISKTFVECIEFRNNQWQAVPSESVASEHRPDGGQSDVNLLVYVLTRDSKLLELREKLEQTPQGEFPPGSKVQFLFKSCKHVNLLAALQTVEAQDSETYLYLNKLAKNLGLKQTPSISIISTPFTAQSGEITPASPQDLVTLIKTDLDQFKAAVGQS